MLRLNDKTTLCVVPRNLYFREWECLKFLRPLVRSLPNRKENFVILPTLDALSLILTMCLSLTNHEILGGLEAHNVTKTLT